MAFGFPAYHKEALTPPAPSSAALRGAVLEAVGALSWQIVSETDAEIVARTTMNFLSWGERIRIRFDGGSSIHITSECQLPTQCIDWGKNRQNVDAFKRILTEFLA